MTENKSTTVYRQQLRERIVDLAMRTFAARGIRAVKMDDVAKTLGISKRTLYELYDNKEALVCEGIKKYRERYEHQMHIMSKESANVMDVVLKTYKLKIEEFKVTCPQFYIDLKKYPKVLAMLDEGTKKNRMHFIEFLKRGVEEGFFRSDVDFDLVSQMFEAIGQYVMSHQLFENHSMEAIFKSMVFSSLRGICTRQGVEIVDKEL